VLVEDVQGKKLQHALWDGSRQIEEWHEVGHGRAGRKEKGLLYTRGLGGELLEQARVTRRGGRSSHASEDDFDEWDDDEDRRGGGGGPRKPKLNHVRWIHPDYLGSTALVTNHRGKVLARPEYGPWGEPLHQNEKIAFGYTGHRREAQTGHWSALHRQLDPRAGRWSQRDPLGMVDGLNRYRYARNSPLASSDPYGLFVIDPALEKKNPQLYARLTRMRGDLLLRVQLFRQSCPLTSEKMKSDLLLLKMRFEDNRFTVRYGGYRDEFSRAITSSSDVPEYVKEFGGVGIIMLYELGVQESDDRLQSVLVHELWHAQLDRSGHYRGTGDHLSPVYFSSPDRDDPEGLGRPDQAGGYWIWRLLPWLKQKGLD
jgi:RHS repeat-associated protein